MNFIPQPVPSHIFSSSSVLLLLILRPSSSSISVLRPILFVPHPSPFLRLLIFSSSVFLLLILRPSSSSSSVLRPLLSVSHLAPSHFFSSSSPLLHNSVSHPLLPVLIMLRPTSSTHAPSHILSSSSPLLLMLRLTSSPYLVLFSSCSVQHPLLI
jgi:hypothetical protein